MFRLIKIEIYKIFSKRTIYFIWILMFVLCFFNNFLYKTDYDNDGNYLYEETEDLKTKKINLEKEISQYSPYKSNELSNYLTLKTKLDILNVQQEFQPTSFQYQNIEEYLFDLYYQKNSAIFSGESDEIIEEIDYQIEENLSKLRMGQYQYFYSLEKENLDKEIAALLIQKESSDDDSAQIEQLLEEKYLSRKVLQYRIKHEIKKDSSYLNKAFINYQESSLKLKELDPNKKKLSYSEKREYQNLKATQLRSEYILKNRINLDKENNLSHQLLTILEDYEIFFVIVILVAVSHLICEEFQKGTVKLLLIKPYSRCKILFSKYFAVLFMLLFSLGLLILMQFVLGGIFFGLDSLKMPVVVYNFHKEVLESYSIGTYMLIRILMRIPTLLFILAMSTVIGVMFSNTVLTALVPLVIYIFGSTIVNIAINYRMQFLKYTIFINWNLEEYLFGKLPIIPFIHFSFSCVVVAIHLILFFLLSVFIFKRKDIKNI